MRRPSLVVLSALLSGALLAACGSTSATPTSSVASPAPTTTVHPPKIAASGIVASLSATSMQVQGTATGETTVEWNATTKFTMTTRTQPSTLSVGSCVLVIEHAPRGSSTPVARTITQEARSTACTKSASTATSAKHHHSRRHSGLHRRHLVLGRVTAVAPTSITVAVATTTTSSPQSVSLALTPTTVVVSHQKAASSDLAVGRCVTVEGSTNSIGVVSARRIAISESKNGACGGTGRKSSSSSGSTSA